MTKYELVKEFAPKRYSEEQIKKIIAKSNKASLEKIYNFWSKSNQDENDRRFCWALV